jgi:hypothetical protein
MTRDELWAAYVRRHPGFAGEGTVTLTTRGLRRLFEHTWEHAHAHGRQTAPPPAEPEDFPDLLRRFSGH